MTPLAAPSLLRSVAEWMRHRFPRSAILDQTERCFRFCEEALERVPSPGVTRAEVLHPVESVFGRDAGSPDKEAGDALIALAALCNARGVPMNIAFPERMRSNWRNADAIRARHESRTARDPRPGAGTREP